MFDRPLLQSQIGDSLWNLAGEDLDIFNEEVTAYFQRGFPRFIIHSIDFENRKVWLKER